MLKAVVKSFIGKVHAKRFQVQAGKNVYIGKHCALKGKSNIVLDDGVTVRPYAQIWSGGGTVRIGRGSEIGERCRISIANSLEIGEKVLLSPNVYITDCDHEYRNIDVPVIEQGIVQKGQAVSIGEIVGNVKIGKHCVIGANSVVTKDVPDYSVAVGIPARVIKNIKNY